MKKQIVIIIVLILSSTFLFSITMLDSDSLSIQEEIKYGTSPFLTDTDNDNLSDGKEVEIGTNPTNPDTDGDSIEDGKEVYNTKDYPDANPLQKDIYIEIDVVTDEFGKKVYTRQKNQYKVKQSFENAPIKNPDGTTGINLHFKNDYIIKNESYLKNNFSINNYSSIRERHFNNSNKIYYHGVAVSSSVCNNDTCEVSGVSIQGKGFYYQFYTHKYNREPPITLMHEIGHQLGITQLTNPAVDSYKKSPEEYPSVMNYNYPTGEIHKPYLYPNDKIYQYSNSDWKTINNSLHIYEYRKIRNVINCIKYCKLSDIQDSIPILRKFYIKPYI